VKATDCPASNCDLIGRSALLRNGWQIGEQHILGGVLTRIPFLPISASAASASTALIASPDCQKTP
jgi:hypothetical protein